MKKTTTYLSFTFALVISFCGLALTQPSATPKEIRLTAKEQRDKLTQKSQLAHVKANNIGPTVQSGRVSDIAVNPKDPSHFYVSYASGGLWKTTNNGASFSPIFDHESVMTIGDIAVDWNTGAIWVGTGEVNSSRSSYAGDGIYKSSNDGKDWQHLGLPETHHIGRIILHPTDTNTVWVAALGHLYSPNEERGIFKTTDGGKTWRKTLYVNDNTGAVDLIIDKSNPDILYTAAWHRERRAWNFVESGTGSGIYKSTNGGETWQKITVEGSGFPTGEDVGRIGLDMYNSKDGNVIYALLDNYERREKEKEADKKELSKDDFKTMSLTDFDNLEDEKLNDFLKSNRFPEKHSASSLKKMVKKGQLAPIQLAEYLEDANRLLFDTPVKGAEVYKSEDGGKSWQKTHEKYIDGIYYSYGYYFGQIRVSPHDPNHLYIMGVPLLISKNGGKSWENINYENVHVDHHALWINPKKPGHLVNGNDGGVNISYDDGANWFKCNSPSVGQFYYINVDMAEPYRVYGGLQDNGVWVGRHTYKHSVNWHQTGHYPYKMIMGGDGMQIQIDNRDNNTTYTGFQFGNYFRIDQATEKRKYITPKHELGHRPYRWNWQSPILLSSHNQDILYMGANKLLRSFDRGDNFDEISEDLTNGGKKGDVAYGTLTAIHESPLKFGLIYTGSDDGVISMTPDGGHTWKNIGQELPKHLWVSRIQASAFDEGTVYLSLNGYRWDDFSSYLYKSTDYGDTWKQIGLDLPQEPINVVKEDTEHKAILYVGTDHATYITLDGGNNFMLLSDEIPKAPVHDLVVHPTAGDLIIGTHGRSMYQVDVKPIRKIVDKLDNAIVILDDITAKHKTNAGTKRNTYSEYVKYQAKFEVYALLGGTATIKLQTEKAKLLREMNISLPKGLSQQEISLHIDTEHKKTLSKYLKDKTEEKVELEPAEDGNIYLPPGEYTLEITVNGQKDTKAISIID